jgi:HEAT repeat protein
VSRDDLDQLFADLGSKDRGTFRNACDELEFAIDEDPQLTEEIARRAEALADDPKPQVRGAAWRLVAAVRMEKALPMLAAHLSEPEPSARQDLADAASIIGKAGRELLRELAKDKTLEVRFEAAQGLSSAKDSAALPVLLEGLEVGDLRYEALTALGTLGDAQALEPVLRIFKKRFFVSDFERARAAWTLGRLGHGEAKDWLLDRVKTLKGDAVGIAVQAVGDLKMLTAVGPLEAILADQGSPFRGAAAAALGAIGADGALAKLTGLLFDEAEDPSARAGAAEGLYHLRTPQAKAALEKARDIEDEEIAAEVSVSLEFFDKPEDER